MPNNIEQKLGNVPLNNILNKNALLNKSVKTEEEALLKTCSQCTAK